MSEKFKNGWQKKDGVSFWIRLLLGVSLVLFIDSIVFLILAVIKGTIVSICWNTAMTTMFGFSKITMFQAIVLACTISFLTHNYYASARLEYERLKRELFVENKSVLVLLVIIFEVILISIAVGVAMYFWNNILPQLLNIELVQINFWQALGFAYLFNLLFYIPQSNDKKFKKAKNSNSKDVLSEAKDDIVHKETTETNDFIG